MAALPAAALTVVRRALERLSTGPWRWLPAATISATIAWLSHRSDWPSAAQGYPDWLLHGAAFGGLAVSIAWALTRGFAGGRVSAGNVVASILLTSLYGAIDELHQSTVPGRDAAVGDWIADTVGASAALLAVSLTFAALRPLWENRARAARPAPSCPDRE